LKAFSTMNSKEELYNSFAELIYSVAMADGIIDDEELAEIKRLTGNHPLGFKIENLITNLSSEDEVSIVQSYKSTLSLCKNIGKDSEYEFLINVLEQFSKVSKTEDSDDDLNEVIISGLKEQLLNN
jgi:uncharacterized tellurite resistance protein B-like protein